jgi:hypothetical protein
MQTETVFRIPGRGSLIRGLTLLLFCAAIRLYAAPDSTSVVADRFAIASPDGRFLFRQTMEAEDGDASFGVIDTRTKRSVLVDPGAALPPMEDSIACLWAPDSRSFAINGRLGGRYETTEFFEWNGKEFRLVPPIDAILAERLAADRNAQLKKAGIPAETYLRHIWDSYKALKWEDARTLQVLASSTRSYQVMKDPETSADIVSAFTFTLKLEKGSLPRIVAQNPTPAKAAADASR